MEISQISRTDVLTTAAVILFASCISFSSAAVAASASVGDLIAAPSGSEIAPAAVILIPDGSPFCVELVRNNPGAASSCLDGCRRPPCCRTHVVRSCRNECRPIKCRRKEPELDCKEEIVCVHETKERCSTLTRLICPEIHRPAPESRPYGDEKKSAKNILVEEILWKALKSVTGEDDGCEYVPDVKCVSLPVNVCRTKKSCKGKKGNNNKSGTSCKFCEEICSDEPRTECGDENCAGSKVNYGDVVCEDPRCQEMVREFCPN